MNRRSDSSGHATMRGFKFRKGFDCLWVADHASNRTSAGGVGGLTLGGSLGSGHEASKQAFINAPLMQFSLKFCNIVSGPFLIMDDQIKCTIGDGFNVAIAVVYKSCRDVFVAIRVNEIFRATDVLADVERFASRCSKLFKVHCSIRVGPIPTMRESLHVTSDESTTVRRVAA